MTVNLIPAHWFYNDGVFLGASCAKQNTRVTLVCFYDTTTKEIVLYLLYSKILKLREIKFLYLLLVLILEFSF